MAAIKANRSAHLKQAARRNNRRANNSSVILNSPQSAVKALYALSRAGARKARIRAGSSAQRRKQVRSTSSTRRSRFQESTTTSRKLLHFPRIRGKVVKEIEFFVDPSHNSLLLRFQDNTSLNFDFATSFAMEAHFSRWKAGNERVLRYWPRLQSEPVF